MNKLVHIEHVDHAYRRNPTLCGIDGNRLITYLNEKGKWIGGKPTCEACILVAWVEPNKVFKLKLFNGRSYNSY